MGKTTFNNLKIRPEREITGAKVHFIYSFPPPTVLTWLKPKRGRGWGGKRGWGIAKDLLGKGPEAWGGEGGWGWGQARGLWASKPHTRSCWSLWPEGRPGSCGWPHRNINYDLGTVTWAARGCCWGCRCCPCCPALWHYPGCHCFGPPHPLSTWHWLLWGRSYWASTPQRQFGSLTAPSMAGRWRRMAWHQPLRKQAQRMVFK